MNILKLSKKIIKISTADGMDCPISIMLIVLMIQIAYSSKAFNLAILPLKDNKTEAPPGFEPGAAALQVQRSTTEL